MLVLLLRLLRLVARVDELHERKTVAGVRRTDRGESGIS